MGNRIPRSFSYIKVEALTNSPACKKGEEAYIFKDDHGYVLRKQGSDKRWRTFLSHLRNENLYRIIAVVK